MRGKFVVDGSNRPLMTEHLENLGSKMVGNASLDDTPMDLGDPFPLNLDGQMLDDLLNKSEDIGAKTTIQGNKHRQRRSLSLGDVAEIIGGFVSPVSHDHRKKTQSDNELPILLSFVDLSSTDEHHRWNNDSMSELGYDDELCGTGGIFEEDEKGLGDDPVIGVERPALEATSESGSENDSLSSSRYKNSFSPKATTAAEINKAMSKLAECMERTARTRNMVENLCQAAMHHTTASEKREQQSSFEGSFEEPISDGPWGRESHSEFEIMLTDVSESNSRRGHVRRNSSTRSLTSVSSDASSRKSEQYSLHRARSMSKHRMVGHERPTLRKHKSESNVFVARGRTGVSREFRSAGIPNQRFLGGQKVRVLDENRHRAGPIASFLLSRKSTVF